MIVKEDGVIFEVTEIDGVEVKKRVKIHSAKIRGGGYKKPIEWYNTQVSFQHSMKLDVVGAPNEEATVSVGSLTFADLVEMAGGSMETFALAWADKVDETMNPSIQEVEAV